MIPQTIQLRYVDKRKLLQFLKRLFPTAKPEMEENDNGVEPTITLYIPRKLTNHQFVLVTMASLFELRNLIAETASLSVCEAQRIFHKDITSIKYISLSGFPPDFLQQENTWSRIQLTKEAYDILSSHTQSQTDFFGLIRGFGRKFEPLDENHVDYYLNTLNTTSPNCKSGTKASWSERQVAVYHRFDANTSQSYWVIVQLPQNDEKALHSRVGRVRQSDYTVTFADAQELERIRKKLIKARLLLKLNTNVGREWASQMRVISKKIGIEDPDLWELMSRFSFSYSQHTLVAESLSARLEGTLTLILHILSFRNTEVGISANLAIRENGEQLRLLTGQIAQENGSMRQITAEMHGDSKFIKVLTLIAVLYTPASLVALAILAHPEIAKHPHIIALDGVCWAVDHADESITPCLVFEKAPLGNLVEFVDTDRGVVHGDFKPENVLVFENEQGLIAKIADFGSSAIVEPSERQYEFPVSGIWTAPEHHHRGVDATTAYGMDLYRLCLVFLWLLLGLSSNINEAAPADRYFTLVDLMQLFEEGKQSQLGTNMSRAPQDTKFNVIYADPVSQNQYHCDFSDNVIFQLSHAMADFLRLQDRLKDAEKVINDALKTQKSIAEADAPALLCYLMLGMIEYDKSNYSTACHIFEDVLMAFEKALGPKHPFVLRAVSNLACAYRVLGRLSEAEQMDLRALNTKRQVLDDGDDPHYSSLTSAANLALTYSSQGRWDEAEELEKWVLEKRLETLGPLDPASLISKKNLALTYLHKSRMAEAKQLLHEVVEVTTLVNWLVLNYEAILVSERIDPFHGTSLILFRCMSASLKEVKDKLESGEEENYEHRYFVPFSYLRSVLSRPVIRTLLVESGIEFYELEELVNRIARGGLRLLGILIYIDAVAAVKNFQELDHSLKRSLDAWLPLDETSVGPIIPAAATRKSFLKRQWTFLTPVLRPDQSLQRLDEKTILPFIESTPLAESGFSMLTRVTLEHLDSGESRSEDKVNRKFLTASHNANGRLTDSQVTLVRKTLIKVKDKSDIETDFTHELHILSCLRHVKHPNVIQLVTAFTIGRSYNFLLPEADGDLHTLMLSTDGMPGLRTEDEILQSLWPLSSALAAVHEYFVPDYGIRRIGCHYDIKPRNILCLRGRLILADFGLSRLVDEEATSRTLFKQGEGWYLAPECNPSDRDFEPGRIGRASDIWSFGCVLSEILAYVSRADGPANVKQYRRDRRIQLTHIKGEYFHSSTDVNPQVIAFLQSFDHEQDGVDPALGSLARLIQNILKFTPDDRPSIGNVTQSLFQISLLEEYRYITSQHFDDPELAVELESLRLWGNEIGLCQPPDGRGEAQSWIQQPHSWQELHEVQRLVHEYAQEITALRSQDLPTITPGFSEAYNLRRLGDKLYSLLPPRRRQTLGSQLEDYLLDGNIAEIQAPNITDEGAQINSNHAFQHRINMRKVALLNTTRKIAELESECSEEQLYYDLGSLRQPFDIFHAHHIGTTVTGSRVLIELLEYRGDWENRVPELRSRVRAIASLRRNNAPSEVFPILRCEGYYHNTKCHHFGLVYAIPPLAANTDPSSLVDIINASSSRAHQPSLTQKFKLAHLLACYVLTLHRGGWVHKNIAGLNIIFFPKVFGGLSPPDSRSGFKSSATNAAAASLASPFFVGFSHGREDVETAFSEGPIEIQNALKEYQHPLYLQATTVSGGEAAGDSVSPPQPPFHRYRLEFDYYSTGLVLLEIALWKPLNQITKRIRGNPREVQRQLLKNHVPMVRTYMGDIYAQCVRLCLEMCDGDGVGVVPIAARSSEQTRALFAAEVVQRLAAAVV
ncbi:hypothetical protein DV737_g5474, partial [Chaetothyriales sp. CBS 132003]